MLIETFVKSSANGSLTKTQTQIVPVWLFIQNNFRYIYCKRAMYTRIELQLCSNAEEGCPENKLALFQCARRNKQRKRFNMTVMTI